MPAAQLSAVRSPHAPGRRDGRAVRSRVPRRAGRSTSRASSAPLTPRTRALLVVTPNNPDRLVRESATSSIASRRSAPRTTSRSSPTRCSPTTSSSPAPARPLRRVLDDAPGGAVGVQPGRAVEVGRAAAGEARVDGARRPDAAGRARRSSGWSSSATPTCRCPRPCRLPRPSCSSAAAPVRAQIQARTAANYRRLVEQVAAVPACRVLHAEGGWYGVLQVPSFGPEEDLVVALVERRRRAGAPGLLLRFSPRVVSRSSACFHPSAIVRRRRRSHPSPRRPRRSSGHA